MACTTTAQLIPYVHLRATATHLPLRGKTLMPAHAGCAGNAPAPRLSRVGVFCSFRARACTHVYRKLRLLESQLWGVQRSRASAATPVSSPEAAQDPRTFLICWVWFHTSCHRCLPAPFLLGEDGADLRWALHRAQAASGKLLGGALVGIFVWRYLPPPPHPHNLAHCPCSSLTGTGQYHLALT